MAYDEDCCSDDDIFLSPSKRIEKKVKQKLTIPVKGIYDEKIRRMKSCLVGIPRPPVEPIPVNFKMEDIELFIYSIQTLDTKSEFSKESDRNQLNARPLGIYLNLDNSCEEIERLGSLYIEKFLPCETVSTMSDHSAYTQLTASAKKRRRCNGWATSPGSRLSYLARRKTTFSVDQVSKLGQPACTKQFLLQRDQVIKGVKSVPLKLKRALFQSPDGDKKSDPFRTPDIRDRKQRLRRLSAPNPNSIRTNSHQTPKETRKQRSCRKSLEFSEEADKGTPPVNESSDKHVKRKLLWAVAAALKSVSVTSSHPKFKLCMNKLFKSSLTFWNEQYRGKKSHQENTSSTSESMLAVAKSLLEKLVLPELKQNEQFKDESILNDNSSASLTANSCLSNDQDSSDFSEDRTPSELTSSETSVISEETSSLSLETKLALAVASSTTLLNSPVREMVTEDSDHCTNNKKELRSCNHKRKRDDVEDEELLNGISSLECFQVSKCSKRTLLQRSVNKLTTNGN